MTPPSSRPILAAQKAYETDPPVIRERVRPAPVELDDADVLEATPMPLTQKRKSTPPPVPASRESGIVSAVAVPAIPKAAKLPDLGGAPDPTDILFDAVYELNFASSPWEAAGMCAETLARALGARTVVIHAHDLERRELKAIGASGDADIDIMGMSESAEDDLVASAVLCNQKSVTMKFDGELPRIAPHRLHLVGAPRSVVAVPAIAWGRCLAIIEVIDADERYDGRVADSAAYVAQRFAEFLTENANAA